MRKGDLIFWITKDDTFIPGKILELRKKSGENTHHAIIKLVVALFLKCKLRYIKYK